MKFFLSLFVVIYFPLGLQAQNATFVEGKIIANNGDTTNVYIERVADSKLSKGINFKNQANDSIIKFFTPNDIRGFYLKKDNVYYESVEYDKDFSKTEKRFAMLIMGGYCGLYNLDLLANEIKEVVDNNNKNVYILKKENTYYTLKNTTSIVNGSYYYDRAYIYTLKEILLNCSSVTDRNIENVSFNSRSLTGILKKYNACIKPEEATKNYNTKTKLKTSHIIYGSYSLYYRIGDNKGTSKSAGYFINIFNPKNNENFALTTGINYLKTNANYKSPNNNIGSDLKLEDNSLRLPLMGTQYFKNSKSLKPFVTMGIMLEYSFSKETSGTGVIEKTEEFAPVIAVGAGLLLKRNIYASMTFEKSVFTSEETKNATLNLNLGLKF
jgi:Outer membrane protein beta-barrel domain